MTPEERAEKIKQILIDCQDGKLDLAVALILAQIREAVEEERRASKDAVAIVVRLSKRDAKAEAYEDAASRICDSCAAAIRARIDEVTK